MENARMAKEARDREKVYNETLYNMLRPDYKDEKGTYEWMFGGKVAWISERYFAVADGVVSCIFFELYLLLYYLLFFLLSHSSPQAMQLR